MKSFEETDLYRLWQDRVQRDPANDLVIVVSASSDTPVSGTGKTTLATTLAKRFDKSSSGFSADAKATTSAHEFANEIIPEVEPKSAVYLEEAQGTPGSGTALNTRRSMSNENLAAIGQVLANRDRRLTTIIVIQQLKMLDSALYPLIDSWLLIRKHPSHPEGPLATHYGVTTNDFDLLNHQIQTPFREDLRWDPLPGDDPDYQKMEEIKQEAKTRGDGGGGDTGSGNGELPKDLQMEIAQSFRDAGKSNKWIADNVDKITYSRETIRRNTVGKQDRENA